MPGYRTLTPTQPDPNLRLQERLADLERQVTDLQRLTQKSRVTSFDLTGPLPVSASYTARGGNNLILYGGTGYANAAGSFAIQLDIDGTYSGSQAYRYVNQTGAHLFFGMATYAWGVPTVGSHTLRLRATSGLLTDGADKYSIIVFEYPQ